MEKAEMHYSKSYSGPMLLLLSLLFFAYLQVRMCRAFFCAPQTYKQDAYHQYAHHHHRDAQWSANDQDVQRRENVLSHQSL
jgi:hypothetical protein